MNPIVKRQWSELRQGIGLNEDIGKAKGDEPPTGGGGTGTAKQEKKLVKPDLLKAALAYANNLGFPVFPLDHNKAPRIPKWDGGNGFHDATTDQATIRAWWKQYPDIGGIGIPTGDRTFDVVDVDPRHGGTESYIELAAGHDAIDQVKQHTGSGGFHLLFRPSGLGCLTAIRPGIDVKANGGYIVVPPSFHPSGKRYKWDPKARIDEVELPTMPGWLLEILRAHKSDNGDRPGAAPPIPEKIITGSRNASLTSLAGTMRRRGASQSAIEVALLTMNTDQCVPPLPTDEVRRIAESVGRYPPAPTAAVTEAQHLTDMGNGYRFAIQHRDVFRYCYLWRKWLAWTGTYWKVDAGSQCAAAAKDTVRSIYAEASEAVDEKERKAIAGWALRSESQQRIVSMLAMAQSELPIEVEVLDRNPWAFNTVTATFDLEGGINNRPHLQTDYITKIAGAEYDPKATCSTFNRFLEDVLPDEDTRRYVQKKLGSCLTGITRDQDISIFWGTGSNGKSTLVEAVTAVLGDYAQNTPVETLLLKRTSDGGSPSPDVARLRGARLVVAKEPEANRRLAESLVKSLTGGDTLAARHLFSEIFEFTPELKLILCTNHRPVIKGTDHAIWRRVRLVPFEVTIPDGDQDPRLGEKLKAEYPGILNWLLEGCRLWQEEGLGKSERIKVATDAYRAEEDVLGEFLDECTQEGKQERATALYDAYLEYSGDSKKSMTQTAFGRLLGERGYAVARPYLAGKRARVWLGLELKAEYQPK